MIDKISVYILAIDSFKINQFLQICFTMKLVVFIFVLGLICACHAQSCTPEETQKCKDEFENAVKECSVRIIDRRKNV